EDAVHRVGAPRLSIDGQTHATSCHHGSTFGGLIRRSRGRVAVERRSEEATAMPVDYETKIFSIATASREFLTIVIGLALSYAIATRASEIPGIKTGELEIWCSQVGAVFV